MATPQSAFDFNWHIAFTGFKEASPGSNLAGQWVATPMKDGRPDFSRTPYYRNVTVRAFASQSKQDEAVGAAYRLILLDVHA